MKKYELVNFCEFDKYAAESYCAVHGADKNDNLGDINNVDETKLSPFNFICGGSPCFVGNTPILTRFGYKNIKDIQVGDEVYTRQGKWRKVTQIGSDGEKPIYTLYATGVLPISCTNNHPFWVKIRYKSWSPGSGRYTYSFTVPQKKQLKDFILTDEIKTYIGVPIIKDRENDLYNLSDELLWLAGRYVADGYKQKNTIILSIGKDKICHFDNIEMPHLIHLHTKSCYRVIFNKSSEIYDLIDKENFGDRAINKTIPIKILELPPAKLKHFIKGYMSGDGCVIEEKGISQATTISRKLAESLVLAVQKTYRVGCKIYYTKRPEKYIIEGREVNQHDTYMIRFINSSKSKTYYVDDDFVWYPIKKIVQEKDYQVVYNITVKRDHTYLANNAAVFNCQDFSIAGDQKGSVWTCEDCKFQYNPLTVHYSKRHRCPNCDSENLAKTRSSLLVEWLRIIRHNKPDWGIYENVKNLVGKKFKDTFQMFIDELTEYGYSCHYKVLNAKDYGIPQNRERVYLIFIKKELDNGKFKFPEPFDNGLRLRDMLEDEVDEKFYVNTDKSKQLIQDLLDSGKLNKEYSNSVRRGGERKHRQASMGYDTDQITGLISNQCSQFDKTIDIANSLLARDYKGFGNQATNGVIECTNMHKH